MAGLRAGGAMAIDQALQKVGIGDGEESDFARREARKFVAELGKLKGSYVKIGQMLALFGEHFLPPVLTEALHELEDKTQPLAWSSIEPSLHEALGKRFDELDIEQEALAAASMAQVHRATIRASGEQICLKIKYPGLDEVIDNDFDAVVRMLLLSRWLKAGRDLDNWLAAMREQLHREADYQREAAMTELMRANVEDWDASHTQAPVFLSVPKTHSRYSGDHVLALDYIEGVNVTDSSIGELSQLQRNAFGKLMLELFFLEVFGWDALQSDPNFGNYLLQTENDTESATLALLDFGSVIQFQRDELEALRQVIASGLEEDEPSLVDGLKKLGWLKSDASEQAVTSFADFCLQILEPLRNPASLPRQYLNAQGEYHWANSRLIQRAGKAGAKKAASRHFATPSKDFVLIARKLAGVFTFIAVLDAEFNGYDIAQKYISRWRNT
ncbi:MAG: AarF/ABC1/UbiB kinase family protein [Pseudomonadales bacterium]|nr:AarF/ABC1/UbiB kinase family protein [Pseudomonadales bacterium]